MHDLHRYLAATLFQVPYDAVTDTQRRQAKAIAYTWNFDADEAHVRETLRSLGINPDPFEELPDTVRVMPGQPIELVWWKNSGPETQVFQEKAALQQELYKAAVAYHQSGDAKAFLAACRNQPPTSDLSKE